MSTLVVISLVFVLVFLYLIFGRKDKSKFLEMDAKGLAKLLISEIKLYQTDKVEQGLENNNLYETLHDEIEAARAKYKKRTANDEFECFFDEALVNILADGDESKLGLTSSSLNK